MKTRRLGKIGIQITEIGLGTNYVGGHGLYQAVDENEGLRLGWSARISARIAANSALQSASQRSVLPAPCAAPDLPFRS